MASASPAETFTRVVAPALGLVLSNAMFMAPLAVRGGRGAPERHVRRRTGAVVC